MPIQLTMHNSRGLQDKVVVITGGLGDIGAATTRKLVALGAQVILFDLLEEGAAAERTHELGGAAYQKVDQGDSNKLHAAIAQVAKDFARLDMVIGNAAVGSGGNLLVRLASCFGYSYRRWNTWFNVTPCSRATRAIDAPGTNVASTIRRFSSGVRRNRFPE